MSNINEDYIEEYIRQVLPQSKSYLKEIENYALKNHIPIIEPEVAQLLRVLLKLYKPKQILEIGTAIGYSALVMAESLKGEGYITTIERRDDMLSLAKENIALSPFKNNISLLKGEAGEILSQLTASYDLIFMDGAKGHYLDFFKWSIKYLNPGGLIIADNVLFRGMVASDNLLVRRKKTIVKRLRKFIKYINEIDGYTSCLIPIGDGVALIYREA